MVIKTRDPLPKPSPARSTAPTQVEKLTPFIFGLDKTRREKLEGVRIKEGLRSEAAALRLLMDEAFKGRGIR